MEYKGYSARVDFDEGANIFHGEVINLRDVVTFEGESVDQLRQAFIDSVDDYLEFCKERGEDPEKPYSGKFVVRVEPELHKRLAIEARKRGVSINALVGEALTKTMNASTHKGLHTSKGPDFDNC
jgi:predicted HicB family RNase H-like nuclease